MNNKFIIDDEFKELLCIQRHSCRSSRQRLEKYDGEDLYKDLSITYDMFEKHLPKCVLNVLDVGCGLGYIDIVINDRLDSSPNFYMFDAMDSHVSGRVKEFYSNLKATRRFMLANGVNENNIFLVDASNTGSNNSVNKDPKCFSCGGRYVGGKKESIKRLPNMDLVVSMYSWGWHFSIKKYIKEVSRIMNTDGLLVLEIKNHALKQGDTSLCKGREEALINNNGFSLVDIVKQKESKRQLLIARKL